MGAEKISNEVVSPPQKRILIVDDAECIRFILSKRIRKFFLDAQIVETASGMLASIELATGTFDLIVTDVHMENGGNGVWLHYFIRDYHSKVPLLFFTASPNEVSQLDATRTIIPKLEINVLIEEMRKKWMRNEIS